MGFKTRIDSRVDRLEAALKTATSVLELYANVGNWSAEPDLDPYGPSYLKFCDVFHGTRYQDGFCPAEDALDKIREILER